MGRKDFGWVGGSLVLIIVLGGFAKPPQKRGKRRNRSPLSAKPKWRRAPSNHDPRAAQQGNTNRREGDEAAARAAEGKEAHRRATQRRYPADRHERHPQPTM